MRPLAVFALLLVAPPLRAEVRTYVIAVGNNAVPFGGDDEALTPLSFADDDAAAFIALFRDIAADSFLLSVLDETSQRRFGDLAAGARAPTLDELARTVAGVRDRILVDRQAGHEADVIFFFSGHGTRSGAPALALLDGGITRELLYRDILSALPARYVHLFVDACYAEAVVRPRDGEAEPVDVIEAQATAWARSRTLARFPNVGAVVATAANQQAHEWDAYQGGVFTHEVLSGLRGAADISGDRKVEYSELHAFLTAANSAIDDDRAKLDVVVTPPRLNLREPLMDLSRLTNHGFAVGSVAELGRFHVEGARGVRLLDARTEDGWTLAVAVPADTDLLLTTDRGEASFTVAAGEEIDLAALVLSPASTTARGGVITSMRRGLFATPYGPLYYRGFVEGTGGASVELTITTAPSTEASATPAWIAFGAAGVLAVTALVTGVVALDARADYDATDIEVRASDARDRYDAMRITTFCLGGAALVGLGVGAWLYPW